MKWYPASVLGQRIYPEIKPSKPEIRRVYTDGKVLLACTQAQRHSPAFLTLAVELIEVVW